MNEYEKATRERSLEIDFEAARLIREGSAPWYALERAGKIVDRRRRSQAANTDFIDDMKEYERDKL